MVHRLREGAKEKSIVLEVAFHKKGGRAGSLGQPKVVWTTVSSRFLGPEVLDKDLLGLEISLGRGQRYIFLKWYRFFPEESRFMSPIFYSFNQHCT